MFNIEYVPVIKAKPLKIEDQAVDEPLKLSEEGNVIITEQRQIHMKKEEFKKSIKALNDKLGFLRFELSDANITRIKHEINDVEKKLNMFQDFFNKLGGN